MNNAGTAGSMSQSSTVNVSMIAAQTIEQVVKQSLQDKELLAILTKSAQDSVVVKKGLDTIVDSLANAAMHISDNIADVAKSAMFIGPIIAIVCAVTGLGLVSKFGPTSGSSVARGINRYIPHILAILCIVFGILCPIYYTQQQTVLGITFGIISVILLLLCLSIGWYRYKHPINSVSPGLQK